MLFMKGIEGGSENIFDFPQKDDLEDSDHSNCTKLWRGKAIQLTRCI